MRFLAIIVLLLFLVGCKDTVTLNGNVVAVEVADTPEERTVGLMRHDYLSEDEGMLFVFEEPQEATFWMKNMKIPLDLVFIDEEKKVLTLYERVPPCPLEICPTYASRGKVKYVLEVNAGYAEENGIKIGDQVEI